MRPTCSHVRRVVGGKSSVPVAGRQEVIGPGKPGPVPKKTGPMTSYRLPCVRVNTYLAGTDDCQTRTGPRKPGPVPENRDRSRAGRRRAGELVYYMMQY